MASIEVRPEDRPLHEDMRYLAAGLGRVIKRLEGDEVFAAVERLRTSCRDRRRQGEGAPTLRSILAHVDTLPLETAAPVARSFTLLLPHQHRRAGPPRAEAPQLRARLGRQSAAG